MGGCICGSWSGGCCVSDSPYYFCDCRDLYQDPFVHAGCCYPQREYSQFLVSAVFVVHVVVFVFVVVSVYVAGGVDVGPSVVGDVVPVFAIVVAAVVVAVVAVVSVAAAQSIVVFVCCYVPQGRLVRHSSVQTGPGAVGVRSVATPASSLLRKAGASLR